jgi:hypothetical protein
VVELLGYLEVQEKDDINIEDLLTARQRNGRMTAPVISAPTAAGCQVGGEIADDAPDTIQQCHLSTPGPSGEDYTLMIGRSPCHWYP